MTAPVPGPPPRPVDPRGPDLPQLRAAVDRAMSELDGLDGRPLPEHVEAFERVHTALGDALAAGSA